MENLIEKRPRIVLLYRASSKQQTEKKQNDEGFIEYDIPLQRSILRPWADKQGEFIKEFVDA